MRAVSLFSGIGGLDVAAEALGLEIVAHVEFSPYCREVLSRHWPEVPCHEDIKDVDWAPYVGVEALVGGFPCQPVSGAGRMKGIEDDRWLWPEFARAIRDLRPRLVLVENVRGLVRRGLGDVLGDLANLGYDARWACLRASSVGAPHRRERIFIVGLPSDPHSEPFPGQRGGGPGDLASSPGPQQGQAQQRQRVRHPASHLGTGTGRGAALAPVPHSRGERCDGGKSLQRDGRYPTLGEQAGDPPGDSRSLPGGCSDLTLLRTPQARDATHGGASDAHARAAAGHSVGLDDQVLTGALKPVYWRQYEPAVLRWESVLGRPAPLPWEDGRNGRPRVTPEFVEWMMGLPEGWTSGNRKDRMKSLGNAVVPQQAVVAYRHLLGLS